MLTLAALDGIPEVEPGDDLARLLVDALPADVRDEDILVLAHKVISKAEGRIRQLTDVVATADAQTLARQLDKDPRHVQVILDESQRILRAQRGVIIAVTHHGFVCANAGVDASNVPGADTVLTLPADPDASARALRAGIRRLTASAPAVLVTDSFGRAWRHGQTDVAIGAAGLSPLSDWRGRPDAHGRELRATWIAVADELAGAADLARSKDGMQPAVLVRGCGGLVSAADGPGAAMLLRPETEDLFR